VGTRPVVIVGAGLAGLTATLQLAREGVPVVALESSGQPGGRARSTVRDGFTLNLGPHGLATAGPGTGILRRLGVDLTGGHPAVPRAKLLVDGRIVGPLDRRGGAGGLRTVAGLARITADARRGDPDGSVAAWLAARVPDQRARGVMTVMARLATYADAFDEQAADVMAEAIRGGGVRYLDGGWGALVARLRAAAEAAGGRVVRTGAGVSRVRRDDRGAWQVVLRDGRELEAGAVILAAGGPGEAAALLEGAAGRTLRGWADRATPVRMAALDVALARRPEMPSLVLGVDEPLYLSVQSDASRIAPDGGAVVQLARFLPLDRPAPADTRARLEALLDQVAGRWRDDLVHARYLPGLTVTHDAGRVATGGRRGRPGPGVPGAPGLYVAGDWVGRSGTLSQASIASAAAAASAASHHLRAGDPRRDRERERV
jgi:phytoene dehydrogenase-like protein